MDRWIINQMNTWVILPGNHFKRLAFGRKDTKKVSLKVNTFFNILTYN